MSKFRFVGYLSCVVYCDLLDEFIVNVFVFVNVVNILLKYIY